MGFVPRVVRRLVAGVTKALRRQLGRRDGPAVAAAEAAAAAAAAAPDLAAAAAGDRDQAEDRVPMAAGDQLETAAATSTSGRQDHRSGGWVRKMLGGSAAAFSALKLHLGGIFWMRERRTEQSEDDGQHLIKRLYEYTKKAISFEALLLAALCNHQSYYFSNTAFKVALSMLLLAFFADIHTALLLFISSSFPIRYLISISSITQMVMPFALLVSYSQLQPSMILIVPFPFFSIAFFHRTSLRTIEATYASTLDHIFDMSAGVYALSTGCSLTSPYFISKESVTALPLACSLFLTIFIARYLMLISTLRPPVIVEHAETLMFILKLLLELTVIFIAMEFLGWRLAFLAILIYVIDAVLFSKYLLIHSPRTTNGEEPRDQRKDRQLLSAAMVAVLFVALTQSHSENAAKQEASLGYAAILRLLLYFGAFLWSLNRMLITLGDMAPLTKGGHTTTARVWTALEWARASVVVIAAVDMTYNFVVSFIVASST